MPDHSLLHRAAQALLAALILLASGLAGAAERDGAGEIHAVLERFAQGERSRSANLVDDTLAESFELQALLGQRLALFSREEFLAGIEAGRFGGSDTTLDVRSVAIDGDTARADFVLEGPDARFHHFATLARETDGRWRLAGSLLRRERLDEPPRVLPRP